MSLNFISDYLPILIIVFTFGLPMENKPEDSMFFTGFIFIGTLLNSSYFLISYS